MPVKVPTPNDTLPLVAESWIHALTELQALMISELGAGKSSKNVGVKLATPRPVDLVNAFTTNKFVSFSFSAP